jgi:hypothetical protein
MDGRSKTSRYKTNFCENKIDALVERRNILYLLHFVYLKNISRTHRRHILP